ncbi:hypothetical protein GH714_018385 [Hevea brasiliensis]|uniref:Uncharacterized protein n=1 Tax=Hevea brasiliensis TaxID=3981 RepID=A0A6A6LKX7_HEVBR|nr:hypothetical protein GH714_018385 [Hevea brasiliensis]
MKANELEKLFAKHKLRVPGDQSVSTRRSKPAELQVEQAINSQYRKPTAVEISPAQVRDKKTGVESIVSASDNAMFSTPPPMKTVDQDYGSSLRQNFSELSFSDDARGKFYERSLGEVSILDGASRSSQNKKLVLNGNLSSSTSCTTAAAPVPRSSVKISNPSSGRQRVQSENPLAKSVPNFSDFRKENTKPSSGVNKMENRTQVRTYAHSKSTTEGTPLVKEEKPRRSQFLTKSSSSPAKFKDLATLNSDEHPGAETSIVKLKGSVASEALENEEAFEEYPFEAENLVNLAKEQEEEELETTEVEDSANTENGKPGLSQESDKMSESENSDSLRSLSQIDPSSAAELSASVPSTFRAVGSLQGSPGESPLSWNSSMHNPFSYPHEISDIDASVDSPVGSPASWNSQSLTHTDSDAAQMRKKWGSAQKPILVSISSHNQPHKDVKKGFKRLLKFGRKVVELRVWLTGFWRQLLKEMMMQKMSEILPIGQQKT